MGTVLLYVIVKGDFKSAAFRVEWHILYSVDPSASTGISLFEERVGYLTVLSQWELIFSYSVKLIFNLYI